jgi:RNA polymerase sigma-32 factor
MASIPPIPVATEDNLTRYLRDIRRIPFLTPTEEVTFAQQWRDNENEAAAHRLVTSHLRFVVKAANKFRGYGLPLADLISEGNVGLIQAVKRFDPSKGFRLATYAIWWIRAAIQEYILTSWSLVKMNTTAARKKLFFNLHRLKAQIGAYGEGDLGPEEVAQISQILQVPAQDVISMDRRLRGPDNSLNAPVGAENDNERQDWLVDQDESPEQVLLAQDEITYRRGLLTDALATLSDRERRIFLERRLKDEPTTLDDLGHEFNVSRERIRQIEFRAFEKVQHHITKHAQHPALAAAA